MKPPPDVTIVVAVRNAADELAETLASIGEQTAVGRVETIVVDGASTDGTTEVARRSPVPDVVISEPDDGIYDAMNIGAARATGTWLHFLNAGDSFAGPESLRRVLDGLDRASAAGRDWFVAGAVYVGGKVDGQVIPNVPHRFRLHAYGLQPHCHQATWFDRERFAALGGYRLDASFAGDFDLILRFGRQGAPGADPRIAIRYRADGLSGRRAAEVPALIRSIRRRQLAPTGAARIVDDVADLAVRGVTRARRIGWFVHAAALYAPKRIARRARSASIRRVADRREGVTR